MCYLRHGSSTFYLLRPIAVPYIAIMVALQNLQIVQNQTGTNGEFLVDRKAPYVHLAVLPF